MAVGPTRPHACVQTKLRPLLYTGGGNFNVPIPGAKDAEEAAETKFEDELSRQIVDAESSSAWTLMHRFNRAADLLNELKEVCLRP